MKVLVVAVAVAATQFCCDPKHEGYATSAESVSICAAHGGVPISEPVLDDGQHTFQILKQCAFPCDQRISVEK